mmetsp:Transcript_62814/g.148750  ORF Transcript_62814/g.148750 Transcript_62814/m.148750 type:complete len:366 (-) Transcript_62814:1850-2947(-)
MSPLLLLDAAPSLALGAALLPTSLALGVLETARPAALVFAVVVTTFLSRLALTSATRSPPSLAEPSASLLPNPLGPAVVAAAASRLALCLARSLGLAALAGRGVLAPHVALDALASAAVALALGPSHLFLLALDPAEPALDLATPAARVLGPLGKTALETALALAGLGAPLLAPHLCKGLALLALVVGQPAVELADLGELLLVAGVAVVAPELTPKLAEVAALLLLLLHPAELASDLPSVLTILADKTAHALAVALSPEPLLHTAHGAPVAARVAADALAVAVPPLLLLEPVHLAPNALGRPLPHTAVGLGALPGTLPLTAVAPSVLGRLRLGLVPRAPRVPPRHLAVPARHLARHPLGLVRGAT